MSYGTHHLVLTDGTTVTIPSIDNNAGWYLRPDEARSKDELRRNTNKSFGRGAGGSDRSHAWLTAYVQTQLDAANWAPVVSHDYPLDNGYLGRTAGIALAVLSEVDGQNWLSYTITEPRWSESKWQAEIAWTGPAIRDWYLNQKVTNSTAASPFRQTVLASEIVSYDTRHDDLYSQAQAFMKDPIGFSERTLKRTFVHKATDLPPLDWPREAAANVYQDAEQTVAISVDRNHVFYGHSGAAKKVFVESIDDIRNLEEALRHLGVNILISTVMTFEDAEKSYARKHRLDGFTIEIEGDPSYDHNMKGHKIEISTRGIEITCGYVTDDKRWETWKARQAADWLKGFEAETLDHQTYEDYEHKPDQSEVH